MAFNRVVLEQRRGKYLGIPNGRHPLCVCHGELNLRNLPEGPAWKGRDEWCPERSGGGPIEECPILDCFEPRHNGTSRCRMRRYPVEQSTSEFVQFRLSLLMGSWLGVVQAEVLMNRRCGQQAWEPLYHNTMTDERGKTMNRFKGIWLGFF